MNAMPSCDSGDCGFTCNAGFTECNGACVNFMTDIANCGGCGKACSTDNVNSLACTGGVCTPACNVGYADCNQTAAPDNGCNTQATGSADNCGGCGNSCKNSNLMEAQGCHQQNFPMFGMEYLCGCSDNNQCVWGSGTHSPQCVSNNLCQCNTGGGNNTTCNPGEACEHHDNNSDQCTCAGGAACPAGNTCCDTPAGCKDTQNDPNNCGGCGRACPPMFSCYNGACFCNGNANACNAGAPAGSFSCPSNGMGSPYCKCGNTTCTAGQRCQPDGSCG